MKPEDQKNDDNNAVEILIVEDSPTQAVKVEYLLEEQGYKTALATNGIEALAMMARHKPTVVLSDVVMPEMGGFELCLAIKRNRELASVPVILLTSLSDSHDVLKGLQSGADYFVTKPYKEESLLACVHQAQANPPMVDTEVSRPGIEVIVDNRTYSITSNREQILNLLLSTYSAAVQRNTSLLQTQAEVRALNEALESRVAERTATLQAEIVERKRAERAHQCFKHIVSGSPDMLALLDRDFVYRAANPEYLNAFGKTESEIIGHAVADVFGNEFFEATIRPHLDHCLIGEDVRYQEWFEFPTSGRQYMDVVYTPYIHEEEVEAFVVCARNITELKQAEEALQKQTYDLNERMKEQDCLYRISDVVREESISMSEMLQKTVNIIPDAWQYPDITCSRIILANYISKTDNFIETIWKQSTDVVVHGHRIGSLEVYYMEERPESDEGPFSKEERTLINAIADVLSRNTERKQAEEALRCSENSLRIYNQMSDLFMTVPDDEIYGEILPLLLEHTHSVFGVFGYIDEEGSLVVPSMTTHIWDKCSIPGKTIIFPRETWGDSSWPRAIREKRVIYSNKPSRNVPQGHVAITRNIAVPIIHHGQAIGLLQVANKETDYEEQDIAYLESVAWRLAPVLDARIQRARHEKSRTKAEEALRKSEAEHRALVENIPQKVFLKDSNSVFISGNENFARDLGITPDELPGKTVFDFFPRELAEKYQADDKQVIETGEILETEEAYIQSSEERIVQTVKVPIRDEAGKITGIFGIFWDITERKRAEERIRNLNQELEARVEQRTAELQASNKELDAFAYSVSHDLRAPLRGINGFSQALLEDYADKLDAQGKDYLCRVQVATQRMGSIIEDLLSLSRITRWEMKCQRIDLSALVEKLANHLTQSQPGRDVEVIIEKGLVVDGDARLLRVVMDNLLCNAWKFTGKQSRAKIEFGATRISDLKEEKRDLHPRDFEFFTDEQVVYSVRDNGVGFDMRYVDKLFGAFQRLHTSAEFEGSGIGLTTVQRAIKRQGGRVWAESEVGRGATFYFTLDGVT